jgi:hypothetical protein
MATKVNKAEMACNKPKRTPGHAKKSHIVKACSGGKDVIRHEEVHLEQMGLKKDESGKYRNDLDYDDEFVYWKGKKYPRSVMDEGNKKLPWEKEAYKANKLKTK